MSQVDLEVHLAVQDHQHLQKIQLQPMLEDGKNLQVLNKTVQQLKIFIGDKTKCLDHLV